MFILKCENDSNFPDVNSSSSILQYTLTTFGMVVFLSLFNLLAKDLEFFQPNYLKIEKEEENDKEFENYSIENKYLSPKKKVQIREEGLINSVSISPKKGNKGDNLLRISEELNEKVQQFN